MLRALLTAACVLPAHAFLEDILRQMHGGQGGGQQQQFHMGGGQRQMGEDPNAFPRGVDDEIAEDFEWMQGTEWMWKEREWTGKVNFEPDGVFRAGTSDCQRGTCKWTAQKGKVYIIWGQSGLHVLTVSKMEPVLGNKMKGRRKKGRAKCSATYVSRDMSGVTRNPYVVLGVDEDAEAKTIKRAYRKLSIKYHPDKNRGDDEAALRFNEVRAAYEVLSDPDKKILFDTGGMKAVREAEKEDASGGGQQQNPFGMMFGGQQQQGQKKRKAKKGPDAQAPITVTLAEMYNGETVRRQIERRIVCRGCKGAAAKSKEKCKKCGACPAEVKTVLRPMGNGMMVQQQVQVASKWMCRKELTQLDIEVEKGMAQGSQITHQRMHDQTPGMIPGDVIFILQQAKHSTFERKGSDLHMRMDITLKEALVGFSKSINHLDGHTVQITRKSVTIPNQRIRVENEGMPVHTFPSQFGNLIVTMRVVFPRTLNDAQQAAFKNLL